MQFSSLPFKHYKALLRLIGCEMDPNLHGPLHTHPNRFIRDPFKRLSFRYTWVLFGPFLSARYGCDLVFTSSTPLSKFGIEYPFPHPSLWPCDIKIWQHKSGSPLAQVITCLMSLSHYLNQYWLIISEVLWHSPESNFTGNAEVIYPWYEFEKWLI